MKNLMSMGSKLCMILTILSPIIFTSCDTGEILKSSGDLEMIHVRTAPPVVPSTIAVPEGFEVSFHAYAEGFQVYESKQTGPDKYEWVFKEPIATLYASPNYTGAVGTHYAGPFWESNSGSKVKAAKVDGVTVDPNSIQWLLLGATLSQGPGVFNGTKFIQRVNTAGGNAPLTGSHAGNIGELLYVPYTAEYYFYKAE